MEDQSFNEPRLALNRIYTKTGDQGDTHLASGERVAKDSPRLECYGCVDELNSFVGAAAVTCNGVPTLAPLAEILIRVQHELFNLGSILATTPEHVHPKQARIADADVSQLESEIDSMNADLPPLRSFVLPGGSRINTDLHIARTVCRRAERLLVGAARQVPIDPVNLRYLNRLSDALFVWSRWANHVQDVEETLWSPNRAASAQRG
ncbi:cob(I)yrinic acid a,c-diamide adenosyltransferase [uncultured Paludibaculum sp.]|uniref:cob(I)yrinic acid a,c-diamide adenosyltransferase n=1 Tax=uncultured Paludibaculum sp. TaxID=1765020 RepID=UPI002AAADAF9|nr:cob(I)yrinic acid a,c-diamide adenosyltransferase [uncultured Paludibaculum sp.]